METINLLLSMEKVTILYLFNLHVNFLFVFRMFSLDIFFRGTGNIDVISESLLYFTAIFIVFLKTINIMIQRKKVIRTIKMLANEICQPRSLNECKILQKFSSICRYVTKVKTCNTLLLSQQTKY